MLMCVLLLLQARDFPPNPCRAAFHALRLQRFRMRSYAADGSGSRDHGP